MYNIYFLHGKILVLKKKMSIKFHKSSSLKYFHFMRLWWAWILKHTALPLTGNSLTSNFDLIVIFKKCILIYYLPIFCTMRSESVWAGTVSGCTNGLVVVSFQTSLKYLSTATPSPQACSKFTAARPSFVRIRQKLLSNHLEERKTFS